LKFLNSFSKNNQIKFSWKSVRLELSWRMRTDGRVDGQTDRQTEMTNLTVSICNFAKTHTSTKQSFRWVSNKFVPLNISCNMKNLFFSLKKFARTWETQISHVNWPKEKNFVEFRSGILGLHIFRWTFMSNSLSAGFIIKSFYGSLVTWLSAIVKNHTFPRWQSLYLNNPLKIRRLLWLLLYFRVIYIPWRRTCWELMTKIGKWLTGKW
jgi:hypothetical protein